MCTGAILLYKIPRVVIGENTTTVGDEELLKENGVEVIVLDDPECKELLGRWIGKNPEVSQIQNVSSHEICLTSLRERRTGTLRIVRMIGFLRL